MKEMWYIQIHTDFRQCYICKLKTGIWEQGRVRKAKETDVEGIRKKYGRKEGSRSRYEMDKGKEEKGRGMMIGQTN
jgi:hypothetical protein